MTTTKTFNTLAKSISKFNCNPLCFGLALLTVVAWAITGPLFGFSQTWQLVINTGTTIITFLMVFLIQNTQNRDNDVLHIKIDELLRVTKEAQNAVLNLDALDTKELHNIRKQYKRIGENQSVEVTCTETVITSNEETSDAKA